LRKMAHSALKRHKGVKSFREADANEGGQGVTIATLA
ncbi:MAG: Smr/MutS family protein, partial [Fimbriimonadaceae bacterium]|nr:Smr/MutS family protein [Fimbriimonadaceae bacterium]